MFEVFRSEKDGKYYFRLKARNGETILSSQAYTERRGCIRGLRSVRKNATEPENYVRRTATDGRFFFVLRAANARVIGTSQMYTSDQGVSGGIESVMQNAPTAEVAAAATDEAPGVP
jgi:uncharacterized protein YegP (UPF0339 family)